jgi:spore coat protein CotF
MTIKDGMYAPEIKAKLIDYFIKNDINKALFGNEVYFGSKKRCADLLKIEKYITAYEIKSDFDKVTHLEAQLSDYLAVFDFVYLVITPKLYLIAKKIVSERVGIILIDYKNITIIKTAKQIKNQNKHELLETVPMSFLKPYFKLQRHLNATQTRSLCAKATLTEIKKCVKNYLVSKLEYGNEVFDNERGTYTHYEDITLLSTKNFILNKP